MRDYDIAALRGALEAFPQTGWYVDREPNEDGADIETGDLLAPTTVAQRLTGADPLQDIGNITPPAAARLAVVAVNALPELLAEADRLAAARDLARRWQANRDEFPESATDALDRLADLLTMDSGSSAIDQL